MRRFLIALFAILLVAPVAAQVMTVRPSVLAPRAPAPQASPATGPQLDIAMDPERARAEINRLRTVNRQLRQSFSVTLADLQNVRGQLDEMTRPGGSLVTAQCVGQNISRNTAGASEACEASGYACAAVTGLCHRMCTSATMCAPGFACNVGTQRCEVPPPASDD